MKLSYSGDTLPTVKLLRNGADFSANPDLSLQVDHASGNILINLKSLKLEDSGTFTVQLSSNGNVSDTADFELIVLDNDEPEE